MLVCVCAPARVVVRWYGWTASMSLAVPPSLSPSTFLLSHSQTIDMVRPPHVDETAWNYSQALVLRLYGVVFGLCVCFIEVGE